MIIKARGLRGWLVFLAVLLVAILVLVLVFNIILLLIPLLLIILGVSYLFRMLNKLKKEKPKDVIDVKFKVK